MLLKSKKRIAALFTAVVMILTTAFSMPIVRAEETASDTDATQETSPADEPAALDLQEDTEEVHDLEGGIWVYKRSAATDKSSLYLEFTGSYSGSTPFIAYDASGNQTESYCMQHDKPAPPEGRDNAVAYQSGVNYATNSQVAGDCALAMFGYGGWMSDPNAAFWDGTTNSQDGGTYGTYLVSDGSGGVKVVRGLMIYGNVYEMTVNEARSIMQTAIHATAAGVDTIGTVYGKTNRNSVHEAYERLVHLSKAAMNRCSIYNGSFGDQRIVSVFNGEKRADSIYASDQSFTIKVYNASTGNWDAFTNTTELPEQYKQADCTTKFKIDYSSWGLCNKLVTSSSSGRMTVNHNYAAYKVGNGTGCYDYFTMSEAAGNTVPFTVSYDKVTAETFDGFDDFWYQTTTPVQSFNQTAYVTCSYEDLQKGTLAFSANTGTAKKHTPYYGDGDGQQGSWYAARLYRNASYQDTLFCSPAASSSASVNATAAALAYGKISIHKYSENPDITNGNSCYNLAGAEFGVYRSQTDASNGSNVVTTITTDAAGNGSSGDLVQGTYYVKETKASPGYRVNNNIYTAVLSSDTPVQLDVPETEQNDPAGVQVRKKNSVKPVYLSDCIFEIKYYDIQMDTDPALSGRNAIRTWYLKTNSNGEADIRNPQSVQSNSSPLYYSRTGYATIPVGTITIQEIQAPEGYVLDSTIHTFKITDNPTGLPHVDVENARTIPNNIMKQPFELVKLAEGRKDTTYPLAEAGFMACRTDALTEVAEDYEAGEDEEIVTDDAGKYYIWDASKAIALTSDNKTEMFTDEDGYAKSIPLEYGKYIVKETTVPHNFHPIKEFTVNITENSDEPVKMGYFTDKSFKAYIRIIKKDDKTDKKILSDAATFKIWSYDDEEYVTFDVTDADGNVTKISEFKTEEGTLMTPGTLMPGKYRIEESECPSGYYNKLQNKSYDITIDADEVYKIYETPEGQVTDMGVFEYEIDNTSLQGTIKLTKNGEKRVYNETKKEFETSKVKLAGITFKIYADEDILAPDGSGDTLYLKDALVDTIVTNQDGNAVTKDLPLGKYRLEEETPAEYVKADPIKVTLAADGQRTKLLNDDGTVIEAVLYELTVDNRLKVPEIHTTATDKDGQKMLKADGSVDIIDKVYYKNLVPGEYEVSGYPVYSNSGEKLTENGKAVEVRTKFTVTTETGSVDVPYTIDATKLAGRSIVFFEFLYRDGELIAFHADIKDQGQTIIFQPNVPKTGDPMKPIIPIALGIIAAAGIVVMIIMKKKHK